MDVGSINGEGLKKLGFRSLQEAFGGPPMVVSDAEKSEFAQKFGAFVTLKVQDDLRGCIGRLDHQTPLWQKIPELAKASAFEDNRFPPLRKAELPGVSLEITLLGEPVEVSDLNEVVIGRDGLIIEKGFYRGLLLPQVATEHGWEIGTFLEHTCLKAGLPPDEWKRKGTKIYRFEGVVF